MLMFCRRWIYNRGFRPKRGSIFYSPSLALIHSIDKEALLQAFENGLGENMSWHYCPKCGAKRKVDTISTPDGWDQPACFNCGDPEYFEPYGKEDDDENQEAEARSGDPEAGREPGEGDRGTT